MVRLPHTGWLGKLVWVKATSFVSWVSFQADVLPHPRLPPSQLFTLTNKELGTQHTTT